MDDDLLKRSMDYCRRLTLSHYENFPVASLLLHPSVRHHLFPIYAFARTADDIADESTDPGKALQQLEQFRRWLTEPAEETYHHPVFPALLETIRQTRLPVKFLCRLLDAFAYDVHHTIFPTWQDMMNYCRNSAQPVGRIVLWLHGKYQSPFLEKSDTLTTALQLVNFWQDISIDVQRGKWYIPKEVFERFGILPADILLSDHRKAREAMIRFLVNKTARLFRYSSGIWKSTPFRLRWELRLTFSGGYRILQKIGELGGTVFFTRPTLKKTDWLIAGIKCL